MRVGGNRKARDFLDSQSDWNDSAPISNKYNCRAAALYKDKVGYGSCQHFKHEKRCICVPL